MNYDDKKIGKFSDDDIFLFKLTAVLLAVISFMFLL